MVYAQTRICPKIAWEFEIQTDYPISAKRSELMMVKKKMRTYRIVYFAVPADHKVKIKENEKSDKHLDLARELENMRNVRVTVIPIAIGALGKEPKGLKRRRLKEFAIGGRIEIIQTTVVLRSARILHRVLEVLAVSQTRVFFIPALADGLSANAGMKNTREVLKFTKTKELVV